MGHSVDSTWYDDTTVITSLELKIPTNDIPSGSIFTLWKRRRVNGGTIVGSVGEKFVDTLHLAGINSYSGSAPIVAGQFSLDPSEYTLNGATLLPEIRVVAAVNSSHFSYCTESISNFIFCNFIIYNNP